MNGDLKRELLDLEREFWRSMKDMDVETAKRLTDDTCLLTGAQGVARIDRAHMAQMLESAQWTLHEFDITDVLVEQIADDVAVVGYKVREKLTVDGKPVEFEAADASTWVRRGGSWVCALHTEAILGDPFGRDRSSSP